ncbi:monosaccharide ABC transporter substrate-binding protein, CUT2 family [Paramicrobacterium humi]|uniref:Monosaccharide ABC transporter substrate-binding protein, CUT2 family n=1 Tax=Paramicrobacterium humi TaxID=640635 RepID=A0A1H4L912_9MICO|nr:ABC transporter substrate-binding protein [Microbacterium humi]SEB67239.1 monosaccharide ABC transporter substrate-binding protein, CUT2 family [Microbacterium humi]
MQSPNSRIRKAGIALSAVALFGLVGCSSSSDAGSSSEAPDAGGKEYTIALVPGMTTHSAYQTMYCGALEAADELGVKVDFQGANAWDPAKQLPVVQSMLATAPDALLLVPADSSALRPAVDQYLAADIPVITVDTGLEDTSGLTAVISSDNVQGGGAAAEALGEAIDGKGTVAIISGVPGATTDVDRVEGFRAVMEEKYPDVKVLEPEYSRSVVATAESQVQALMLAHSDLTGVFGVNGNSATGAANAVVNSGHAGDIVVAGYDAEPGTVEQLRAGNINILVVQDFIQEGRLGVEYAYAKLTGDESKIDTPRVLDNIIATTDNADDPEISKYFYIESCL